MKVHVDGNSPSIITNHVRDDTLRKAKVFAAGNVCSEEPHTRYLIQVENKAGNIWTVYTRYSEFAAAETQANTNWQLPSLPPKFITILGVNDAVIEKRARGLNVWLHAAIQEQQRNPQRWLVEFLTKNKDRSPLITSRITLAKVQVPPVDEPQQSHVKSIFDFTFIKTVGNGSFGKVVLAQAEGNSYAIKVLDKAEMIRRKQLERLQIERMCMVLSNCPFIVTLHAAFQNESQRSFFRG